ncbi:hypothetical protein B0H67DRAFT_487068 [Lasiosphaeris hirsuta]|uniref:Uncharacterized protein n=1 Tax=Lasiosphaeris hirsuta TaxID=260670 RepID=A0AA40DZ06_9PEZI|nr:hypothetical protein B0H67DRAFT_487068 [Lasiosphaeris hirsuta]
MAATPFDASGPGTSFVFDIYNDGQALRSMPALPGGPCNYTDQSLPRCGCRRFWSRLSLNAGFPDNLTTNLAEVCMCSHHACFHEDVQAGQTQPPPLVNVGGQENQRPKTNREPLTPVQDLGSFHLPSNIGSGLDFDLLNFQSPNLNQPQVESANPLHVEDALPGQDSPMPDTLNSWGNLIQSQPGHGGLDALPPIPHQCLMPPSQPPSSASSSQARYLRPFAGKGLHTLSGGSALRNEAPQPQPEDDADVATADTKLGAANDSTRPGQTQDGQMGGFGNDTWQKLSNTVDNHEHRLDRLENTSFSVTGHEDCHDKHEHADLRVTELESRVEEVEKILNDNGSIGSSRRTIRADGLADDATASVVSVSTNATVLTSNRAEIYSQLQALQAQVSQLQASSLPTYTKPWELEVVFLPFPLKGVWMEAREFQNQRLSTGPNAGGWTQMPNTISRATPDPQSPKFMEWPGQSAESNWLLPRAFAADRVIDQRLKSRGLIKTILVRGPDARSIQLAIHNAFGDVFRISSNAGSRSGYGHNSTTADFLGLRQSWVPLRKLHKDSRLRFLAPAEMATPALWDFSFLISSVVMKATGTYRLYVTQPEAYLQDHPLGYQAFESGWSWQKLRELTRVYPDSQSSSGSVPEADAMEDCWAWNDRLDEVPSANTSALSLRQGHQQRLSRLSSTSLSQQFYTGVQSPILSSSPGVGRAQSPLTQRERRGSRPPHIRTNSLPPVAPFLMSPSQSRRRVSSNNTSGAGYERRSSPLISRPSQRLSAQHALAGPTISASAALISKRRLNTRSPSLIPRNTPRWSRTSMSRSPSLAPAGGLLGFHDERDRERRTTPFYYATPHSDALPEPQGYQRAGSRAPTAMRPNNGYDPNHDEDMEDDFGDDQGSSTDPYDSEMTNDADGRPKKRLAHNGSFGLGVGTDDGDFDIDVYEDEDEDELDDIETDADHDAGAWHRVNQPHHGAPGRPRPEDIPWAGIEDQMSDGENVDPSSDSQSQDIEIHEDIDIADRDDAEGDAGSGLDSQPPSEYSSKQNAWPTPLASSGVEAQGGARVEEQDLGEMGFRIHEDGVGGGMGIGMR